MAFAKLKIFTGSTLFLLLAGAVAPAGMAQMSEMNKLNCPEAYRGNVIDVDNEFVTIERTNGDKELLDISLIEQSLLGVGRGSLLVVCEDGKVTNAIEEMEYSTSEESGLRDRIAETFRRLEEEQAARRRTAARELEVIRTERTRTQPVRVAPAATPPRPIPQPQPAVRVEEARPVRALW